MQLPGKVTAAARRTADKLQCAARLFPEFALYKMLLEMVSVLISGQPLRTTHRGHADPLRCTGEGSSGH